MRKLTDIPKSFKIFNDTKITFGFMDRLRIMCGKEVTVSITIHTEKEVEIFNKLTEHSVNVKPFIKIKNGEGLMMPTNQLENYEKLNRNIG